MSTPRILYDGSNVLHDESNVLFAGRLLGGLDFQDSDSKAQGAFDANQVIEDGDFIFVIFTVRTISISAHSLLRRTRDADGEQAYIVFSDGGSFLQLRAGNTEIAGTYAMNSNDLGSWGVGDIILFGINCKSKNNHDYVISRLNTGEIITSIDAGLAGRNPIAHSPSDTLSLGIDISLNGGAATPYVINAFGLITGTFSEQELIDFAKAEGMRVPNTKTIKYYYDFREKGGTTLSGRGSGSVDLTLTNFLSTTEDDPDNRWVHPYTLQAK